MICPKPVFDDIENLRSLRGARLASARPHRDSMPSHLDAEATCSDYRIGVDFLLSYSASADTFSSYRREVDRFILWLWFVRKAHLSDVKRNDIESYLDFCKNPPLEWRACEMNRRFLDVNGLREPNPEWRPFVSKVSKAARSNGASPSEKQWRQSASALKSTFAILRTFFEFLLNEDLVMRNPVAQIKARARKATSTQRKQSIKRLNQTQISIIFSALDELKARHSPEQYERLRFMVSCLIAMYVRISEIASPGDRQPVHGDFFYKLHTIDNVEVKTWWFRVVGKGNKERMIPVNDELLSDLRRYRTSLGLSPLPAIGEKLPLFQKTLGKGGLSSSRHVRAMLQELFDIAAQRLLSEGKSDEADGLMACTAHWLRHTGISEDAQIRPLSHVRDGAGHASIATTGIYVDNDDYEVHLSARQSGLLGKFREES